MEVLSATGAISRAKLQSNHHHQQTNIQFFTGRMPFLSPNQQCQSIEWKMEEDTVHVESLNPIYRDSGSEPRSVARTDY